MSPSKVAGIDKELMQISDRLGRIEGQLTAMSDLPARVQALEINGVGQKGMPDRMNVVEKWQTARPQDVAQQLRDLERWRDKADAVIDMVRLLFIPILLNTLLLIVKLLMDYAATGRP